MPAAVRLYESFSKLADWKFGLVTATSTAGSVKDILVDKHKNLLNSSLCAMVVIFYAGANFTCSLSSK